MKVFDEFPTSNVRALLIPCGLGIIMIMDGVQTHSWRTVFAGFIYVFGSFLLDLLLTSLA
jgi:hypothetical protein